ncbi:MAG: PilZ domain-containing protein [Myxococcota bacterium]|nr:PilZ domain-containing protein [Myxococcota bacterium]
MGREYHRIPVDFYVNKLVDGVPVMARARNLSMGGLYLDRLIEPSTDENARTSVEFVLPGHDDILWIETELMHGDDDDGHGFAFRNLSPSIAHRLQSFMDEQSAMALKAMPTA